jgi:alkylation response protein AidB-like acyl-CoA dehydrogenase
MDFSWSSEQSEFRQRVRAFLARELLPDWDQVAVHGPASSGITEFSMKFCQKLAREGLLVPHWPSAYGGQDGGAWQHFIVGEEMWAAGEPRGGQYMNVNWIGPTLIRFGTEEQKARYLPPMSEGRELWCQGFSEPGAGSDLAGLRTRAKPVEGGYRINGQKIWTSYAGLATTCFLLARTSEDRKSGLAIFLMPMNTPGITVREIPSLVGRGDIHEVFLDDVFVPVSARLGEEGQAWPIITYSLANERIGIPRYALAERVLDRAVRHLKQTGDYARAEVRQRAAQALAACRAAQLLSYRVIDQRARGLPPTADSSVGRIAVIAAERAVADFVAEFHFSALCGEDQLSLAHHQRAITASVAAGAAEIQLNLIASQFLKLPR